VNGGLGFIGTEGLETKRVGVENAGGAFGADAGYEVVARDAAVPTGTTQPAVRLMI
jgi:hypothetical protein